MRKINGKDLSFVMEELKHPFDAYNIDNDGRPNIPYEVFRERANQVLGFNYSDEHTIVFKEVEGEHVVCVDMKISIFDDDGVLVASRCHTRSSVLTRYSKEYKKGQIIFTNDDFSSTVSLAFKKAFTKFGLGDQFALAAAVNKMDHKVGNTEPTTKGPKRVKGYLTLIEKGSNENGTFYIFQNDVGQTIEFKVIKPEEVENYVKLDSMAVGSSAEVKFFIPDKKLIGVV